MNRNARIAVALVLAVGVIVFKRQHDADKPAPTTPATAAAPTGPAGDDLALRPTRTLGKLAPTLDAATKERRDYILAEELKYSKISQEVYDAAIAEPITPNITEPSTGCATAGNAAYFCEYVLNVLRNDEAFGADDDERRVTLAREEVSRRDRKLPRTGHPHDVDVADGRSMAHECVERTVDELFDDGLIEPTSDDGEPAFGTGWCSGEFSHYGKSGKNRRAGPTPCASRRASG